MNKVLGSIPWIILWIATVPVMAQKAESRATTAYLSRYVGKYPSDVKLWTTQPLNRRLHALLKTQYGALIHNMEVNNPIEKADTVLYTMGNKTHGGGTDDAWFVVDPKKDIINVFLRVGSQLKIYKERNISLPLPKAMKEWLKDAQRSP